MTAGWYVPAPFAEQHYITSAGQSLCGITPRDSEAQYQKNPKAGRCGWCQHRTGSLKVKKQGENSRATQTATSNPPV